MYKLGLAFLLGSLCVGGMAQAGTVNSDQIKISIDGDRDTRFQGSCEVVQGETAQTFELADAVPYERTVTGDSVTCRIEQESPGSLEIIMLKGTNRSRSQTSGAGSTIKISMG